MDKLNLLPCPFCGGSVALELASVTESAMYGRREWWGVKCRNTINVGGTCAIEQIPSASREAAAERWNRRAAPSSSADELPPPEYPAIMVGLGPGPKKQAGYTADQVRAILAADRRARQGEPVAWRLSEREVELLALEHSSACNTGVYYEFNAQGLDAFALDIMNRCRAAIQAAAPADALGIPRESNDALIALARYWKLDGDWMTCKGCKRSLIASRDGEELSHASGCKFSDQQHPWAQLRKLISCRATGTDRAQAGEARNAILEEAARVVLDGNYWNGAPSVAYEAAVDRAAAIRALKRTG